jgi:hypothetical protein
MYDRLVEYFAELGARLSPVTYCRSLLDKNWEVLREISETIKYLLE